jgi:hypothetical protein
MFAAAPDQLLPQSWQVPGVTSVKKDEYLTEIVHKIVSQKRVN